MPAQPYSQAYYEQLALERGGKVNGCAQVEQKEVMPGAVLSTEKTDQNIRRNIRAAKPAPAQHAQATAGAVSKPKQSEAAFQAQVIAFAQLHKWRVAHFRKVRVQRKNGQVYWETPVAADGTGFPDLILVRGARLLVVELKVPPNKPSAEQIAWLGSFRGIAGLYVAVWTPDDWPTIEKELT